MGVPERGAWYAQGPYHGFMVHLPGDKVPSILGFNFEHTRKDFQASSDLKSGSQSSVPSLQVPSFPLKGLLGLFLAGTATLLLCCHEIGLSPVGFSCGRKPFPSSLASCAGRVYHSSTPLLSS